MLGQAGVAEAGWEGPRQWTDLYGLDCSRSIISCNLNGIKGKLGELAAFVKLHRPLAVAVQETRLAAGSAGSVALDGYVLFSQERVAGTGGGVAVLVRADVRSARLRLRLGPVEAVVVRLTVPAKATLVVACVYRPPDESRALGNRWEDGFGAVVAQLGEEAARTVMLGDFNLARGEAEAASVETLLQDAGFSVLSTPPTHGPLDAGRPIDWAAVGSSLVSGVFGIGASFEKRATGHRMVFVAPRVKALPTPKPVFAWRLLDHWDQADMRGFEERLEVAAREVEAVAATSPSTALDVLNTHVLLGLSQFVPKRCVRVKTVDPAPWLSVGTEDALVAKQRAWRERTAAVRRHGRESLEAQRAAQHLHHLHREARRRVRKDRAQWISRIFAEAKTVEQLWKAVGLAQGTGRKAASCLPGPEELAAHFKRVYSNAAAFHADGHGLRLDLGDERADAGPSAGPLPPVHVPRLYSRDQLLQLRPDPQQDHRQPDAAVLWPTDVTCDAGWVDEAFGNLRHSIAAGLDGISARVAFRLRPFLCAPLAAIINGAVETGEWPRAWKRARLTAIPKVPGTDDPAQHRPIAILPFLSKIAEQWLVERLRDFYHPHPCQFGFKERSGVQDAQADLQWGLAELFGTVPRPRGAVLVSLDVQKAFDSIAFETLARRLDAEGVPLGLVRLLDDYVRGRSAVVKTSEGMSACFSMDTGVPQGSRLGPVLFSCYINSVFRLKLSAGASLRGYADDLMMVKPWGSARQMEELQVDVDTIVDHLANDLGLRINGAKSEALLVHFSSRLSAEEAELRLWAAGGQIRQVELLRYLGTFWDGRLNLQRHWDQAHTKAKSLTYRTHSCFGRHVAPCVFRNFWKSRVEPVLSWGFHSTGPKLAGSVVQQERVWKHAAHLVARSDFRGAYAPALHELRVQPLWIRLIVLECGFVYACLAGLRECRWICGAVPDQRTLRRSQRVGQQTTARHPFQVLEPPTSLAAIHDLPLLRGIRHWNRLRLEPGEILYLGTLNKDCVSWWREFGHRVILRSLPDLQLASPRSAFPFNLHQRL